MNYSTDSCALSTSQYSFIKITAIIWNQKKDSCKGKKKHFFSFLFVCVCVYFTHLNLCFSPQKKIGICNQKHLCIIWKKAAMPQGKLFHTHSKGMCMFWRGKECTSATWGTHYGLTDSLTCFCALLRSFLSCLPSCDLGWETWFRGAKVIELLYCLLFTV